MAMISSGGRVEAKSQREYLPGNSYPEERYTPRCVSRSFRRRLRPFLKGTLETPRVTAIPLRVEYLSSRMTYLDGYLPEYPLWAGLSTHLFQLTVDGGFADAEQACRLSFVERGDLQRTQDRLLFKSRQVELARSERLLLHGSASGASDGFRQMRRQNRLIHRSRRRGFESRFQLAHIAGPMVSAKRIGSLLAQREAAALPPEPGEEILRQQRDILQTPAQRRYL